MLLNKGGVTNLDNPNTKVSDEKYSFLKNLLKNPLGIVTCWLGLFFVVAAILLPILYWVWTVFLDVDILTFLQVFGGLVGVGSLALGAFSVHLATKDAPKIAEKLGTIASTVNRLEKHLDQSPTTREVSELMGLIAKLIKEGNVAKLQANVHDRDKVSSPFFEKRVTDDEF